MLRFIALALTVTLALGASACGRKSAPRLPEGEQLKVRQEGGRDTLSVYSPYEEQIEQDAAAGADLVAGVQDDTDDDTLDLPDFPSKRPRKDNWSRLDRSSEDVKAARRRPLRDAVERVQKSVEDPTDFKGPVPGTEQDYSAADQGGLPASPGGPTEGGF